MSRRLGASRDRSGGQALVEFAFVFPLIALLGFAFVDLGLAVFHMNTLASSARDASRVAAVNQLDPVSAPWNCQSNRPVENVLTPNWTFRGCAMQAGATIGVAPSDVTVSYAPPPGVTLECTAPVSVGCIATVTVVSTYTPITPVAGAVIGAIPMSATSAMPVERTYP